MECEHCVGVLLYGPDLDLAACGLACAAAPQHLTIAGLHRRQGLSHGVHRDLLLGSANAVGLIIGHPQTPAWQLKPNKGRVHPLWTCLLSPGPSRVRVAHLLGEKL